MNSGIVYSSDVKRLDKTKLVKEMAREQIGQPRTTQRLNEKEEDITVCPDCKLKWEKCMCDGAYDEW